MLKTHINAVEESLLATSRIPANTGHSLHKGTPREAFIREFLEGHLSERVAIGTGEIIDANSRPKEPRNQIDIVLYKRDYPRLNFGGGVSGFLAESVVATIEVKSVLDAAGINQAIGTSRAVKRLSRSVITSFQSGYQPPSILSFVVAYDGPAAMGTVHGWLTREHQAQAIAYPPQTVDPQQRISTASPTLDGVFVLGRGFMQFDNTPVSFITDEMRGANPRTRWVMANISTGSLLYLFIILTQAVSGVSGSWLEPNPYLKGFQVPLHLGP